MKYTPKQYAKALMDAIQETNPKDQEKVLDNFVKLLVENNDLRLFDQIAGEFHKLDLGRQGIRQAEVKSTHPLTKDNEKAILEELNKLAKTKIELKTEIDERLIGGVVIQMDDQLIDASVKNQLEQLRNNLTQ
ncbi:MAG: ATP synthase F1 subunit delta [Candidatus Doudnabacteria bacterium RIFCSPLOWO2_02_FULL_49_13]|uniref:ATP synthase subunit delta n=1 Tax=Candidatus Doudnabacteria bacterium RIFCSPHIGHO2_12_FULL_48_16 TaxID=1817838 RepID=A0A1F5PM31_9BACT|nr:MAG: ATP synthase F1 subunit delta [Candidatus Doudnabacteria bacterium RIFCSPHIGHO2_02_FULL_49_24]OGE89469.1 MAG: ATP synthase F1 subunit delta [Candidatus Doudnabacteria bacterium RIFCSPHIGHO2_01_FULL_50_67]OGE90864.1 MAG: ATP synthase F1 subunit delta [Candidatus Doudnabacteria bacterium RIFCSPHIGHO2_12_FULL_48_16]OGE97575.1 MAG: ATP synthase F1 subunit delta [Candidatus Doudnabacteria bacterium RIFCSPLOWO2_01_FULL_49_40]OGF02739.1 MAG: ATP synthase F1 subunit delta [Candidatus Doudnabact